MSTRAGDLVATWAGSGSVRAGEEIDVELDASEPLAWDDVRIDAAPQPSFELAGDAVLMTGQVVEIEHSGVIVVDVGGALLSFDMEGTAPTQIIGRLVSVRVHDLAAYPTGI